MKDSRDARLDAEACQEDIERALEFYGCDIVIDTDSGVWAAVPHGYEFEVVLESEMH